MLRRLGMSGALVLLISGCDVNALTNTNPPEPESDKESEQVVETKAPPQALPDDVVARVNGENIHAATGMSNLDDVVVMEILAQQARQGGIDIEAIDTIRADTAQFERELLMQAFVEQFLETTDVTAQMVSDRYAEWIESQPGTEYNFMFARFDQQEKAQAVIADIQENETPDLSDFQALRTAASEAAIEWATLDQLPPMFASVLPTLSASSTHDMPLTSNQGYFVVYLNDSRARDLPELDEVAAELEEVLKREQLRDHINDIRKGMTIQIK